MIALLRLGLVGLVAITPVLAESPKTDAASLLAAARTAEKLKQFDKAMDLYVRGFLAGERGPEVRERIHDCFRQTAQTRRHKDATFREYVLALPPAEGLNLYAEVIEKLSTHYAEKEKAKPERLFALSVQEIERALLSAPYRKQYLPNVDEARVTAFVKTLKDWAAKQPQSPRESRILLQQLVHSAQNELQAADATHFILEAICGACAGLDEGTTYLPPASVKEKSTDSTITRAEMIDLMGGVGVITISRFREATPRDFDSAIQRLKMEGLRSLIIDLRGNSGGSFPAAIQLAERFIPSGVLTTTMAQVPEFDGRIFTSSSGMSALDLPVVILVDGRTMSAAEVFASAMKQNSRATLIGMTTYGKGSVQAPLPLDSAEGIEFRRPRSGVLVMTIAKVLQPNGTMLHESGVEPHVIESNPELQMRLAIQRATIRE